MLLPDRRISLGTGDFFGEMSLITGEPRQADVRSQTHCRLLELPKASFDPFIRANPDVRRKIGETAKQRVLANKTAAAAPLQRVRQSRPNGWRP